MRSLVALSFALHLALTGGAFASVSPCAEQCADDDEKGACSPDCADCSCCPHIRVLATAASVAVPPPEAKSTVIERAADAPPAPDPHDISHVPIA